MRLGIVIGALILLGFALLLSLSRREKIIPFEQAVLTGSEYAAAAESIAAQINSLSPTPPAGHEWIATEADFVKNLPFVYVTFTDTRNIFRILLETGRDNQYRVAATFEMGDGGWQKKFGADLAAGKKLVNIKLQ